MSVYVRVHLCLFHLIIWAAGTFHKAGGFIRTGCFSSSGEGDLFLLCPLWSSNADLTRSPVCEAKHYLWSLLFNLPVVLRKLLISLTSGSCDQSPLRYLLFVFCAQSPCSPRSVQQEWLWGMEVSGKQQTEVSKRYTGISALRKSSLGFLDFCLRIWMLHLQL